MLVCTVQCQPARSVHDNLTRYIATEVSGLFAGWVSKIGDSRYLCAIVSCALTRLGGDILVGAVSVLLVRLV